MNNKVIVITGGDGKVARLIVKNNYHNKKYTILSPNKETLDIRFSSKIEDFLSKYGKVDYIIHAAAITRPMIQHEINPLDSIETNIIGTCNIVKSCIKRNIKLCYISTDYVYGCPNHKNKNGFSCFSEEDGVKPVNKYGWSKLGGECAVKMYDNSLILRCCIVNTPFPHKIAYDNIYKTPITDEDFSKIILSFLDKTGIINVGHICGSMGFGITPYDFAVEKKFTIDRGKWNKEDNILSQDSTMNTELMYGILKDDNKS